ncbi:aldehyde dehydrogenase family protein [Microbulbifer mangrovi]|uniref:aldehyde dehydrogenase family protein n=1 Tax=Microbulbifer mangrovi TaxID=927787 RepID=UPI00099089E8|nr:aldehyde dehydrogenase family protein [Microbulbifer mangrovi]
MQVADIFKTMNYGPAQVDTAEVDSWLDTHAEGFGLFINGEWVSSTETLDSVNPASGRRLATISAAGSDAVDAAVEAAHVAQPTWEKLGGRGRARYLYKLAQLLRKQVWKFAVLESLDSGKPIRETSNIDLPRASACFQHYAGRAQLFDTEFSGRQARGAAGLFIPASFPLLVAAQKIAPALAAGNCIVLKPSEHTSLTALMFAELCEEAGLPPGVVNIVTGGPATGAYLVDHADVDLLDFTGSAAVGRAIRSRTAGSDKALKLELAGKRPFIFFEDADLDSAVEGLVDAVWCNQGHGAWTSAQLLVQEGIEAAAIAKIRARMETLRVGDPLDSNADLGAIVDPARYARIAELVTQGVDDGGELWQSPVPSSQEGQFYPPTLLSGVEPSNTVAREGAFGPVLSVMSFRLQSEAVLLANGFGRSALASVWSENMNRTLEVGPSLNAGTICINSCNPFDIDCGFDGQAGCESGAEGLEVYLRPCFEFSNSVTHPGKTVTTNTSKSGSIAAAVEAALKMESWSRTSGYQRAGTLYALAEDLSARAEEFCWHLGQSGGESEPAVKREVEASVERLFTYAAWADQYEGAVRRQSPSGIAMSLNEAVGVVGIAFPDQLPLLALISLLAPVIAVGNRVVLVPSENNTQVGPGFYGLLTQLLESAGIPVGVVNIVTGIRDDLIQQLAAHGQVDHVWYFGSAEGSRRIEQAAAQTTKRTWVNRGKFPDWLSLVEGEGKHFLREARAVKNILIPCGN